MLLINDEYLLYYYVWRGEMLRRNDDFQFLKYYVYAYTYISKHFYNEYITF